MGRKRICAVFVAALTLTATTLAAQQADPPTPKTPEAAPEPNSPPAQNSFEGTMTIEQMGEIVQRLDANAQSPRRGMWQLTISDVPAIIVTDEKHNRMRVMSPVRPLEKVTDDEMKRTMQANFDSALDARYAVAKGLLWGTFIHPLKELHPRQFISGIGQTINLVKTFGKTFSSGAMTFGGGDSRSLIEKELLDELQRKGLPI